MLEYACLEWRKDRTLFGGMAAAFVASLPVVGLIARLNRHSVPWGIDAALLFWTLVGIPVAALVFGAATSSGLRQQSSSAADAPLPISPRERAFGAALGGMTGLGFLILCVLLVSTAISPNWRMALSQHDFASVMLIPYFSVELFVVVHAFLLAFALSYLLEHGVAGAALALLPAGLTAAVLTRNYAISSLFGPRVPSWPTLAIVILVCSGGAALILGWAAPWRSRLEKRGWLQGAKMAAVIAAGLLVSLAGAATYNHRMARSPQFVRAQSEAWASLSGDAASQEALREAGQGVLMDSLAGEVLLALPEGRPRVLIPPEAVDPDLLREPYGRRTRASAVDASGRRWLLRQTSAEASTYEVWSGPAEGPLKKLAAFSGMVPLTMDVTGRRPLILAQALGAGPTRWLWAEADPQTAALQWRPAGNIEHVREWILRHRVEQGSGAAFIANSRRMTLKAAGAKRTWAFPAGAAVMDAAQQLLVGGAQAFFVTIRTSPNKEALAVCREGGKVDIKWREFDYIPRSWNTAPDGTLWALTEARLLFTVAADGRFLPPVRLDASVNEEGYASLVHQAAGAAWLLSGETLLSKVDLGSGRVVARWRLPDSRRMHDHFLSSAMAARDGLFVRTPRDLFFYDWDGHKRRLAL